VSKQYQKLFPVKIHSRVTSWKRESFLEYKVRKKKTKNVNPKILVNLMTMG
jgi:hypothetical protein